MDQPEGTLRLCVMVRVCTEPSAPRSQAASTRKGCKIYLGVTGGPLEDEFLRFGTLQDNCIFTKMDGTKFTKDECTRDLGFFGIVLSHDRYSGLDSNHRRYPSPNPNHKT